MGSRPRSPNCCGGTRYGSGRIFGPIPVAARHAGGAARRARPSWRWPMPGATTATRRRCTGWSRRTCASPSRWRRKFKRYGAPMNDLIQEAGLGLMKAADKFDPDRGVRFSTYAVWWIKASIQDYVMRNWSMVRTGLDLVAEVAVLQHAPRPGPARARGRGAGRAARQPPGAPAHRHRGRRAAARRGDDGGAAGRLGLLAQRHPVRRGRGARVDRHAGGRGRAGGAAPSRATRTSTRCAAGSSPRCRRSTSASGSSCASASCATSRGRWRASGDELGLSKERVRQLEAAAFGKMRRSLENTSREVREFFA